jgi:UDP-glucose 4-epimerase
VSSSRRVLLTGANGHVGGRLLKHLIETHSTDCTVDLRAVVRPGRNLPDWTSVTEIIHGEIAEPKVRESMLRDVHTVVHLATRGFSTRISPTITELNDERAVTMGLLHDAQRLGARRFVYLSSIHAYGSALVGDVDDFTPPVPVTEYGRSRQRIEDDLVELAAGSECEAVVVRLTNSFGTPVQPRDETWNLLVHDLCHQAVAGNTIVLRSDPRTCRDVMALRDVVAVLGQVIDAPSVTSGAYLLASGTTFSLAEIASLVARLACEELGKTCNVRIGELSHSAPPSFTLHPRRLGEVGIEIPQDRDAEIRDLLRYSRDTLSSRPQ